MALARTVTAKQAVNYYYQKDPHKEDLKSEWLGKLAESFGLSGEIDKKDFENFVWGKDRNRNQLIPIKMKDNHRAGVDLTFCAPKSISILALHGEDKNLFQAHLESVKETLKYIEKSFSNYRKTEGHETSIRNSSESLFALFHHTTSRSNDPHLHTHSIMMNMVKTEENDLKAHFNDYIFSNQTLFLTSYRNTLLNKVRDLNYEIRPTKNGLWEIKGVSEKTIQTFSKRSAEIEHCLPEIKEKYPNASEKELRDKATLISRNLKDKSISKDSIKRLWEQQIPKNNLLEIEKTSNPKNNSVTFSDKISNLLQLKNGNDSSNKNFKSDLLSPEESLSLSTNILHERESVFSLKELFNNALSISSNSVQEIEKAFKDMVDNKTIIPLNKDEKLDPSNQYFTTDKIQDAEKSILNDIKKAEQVKPILKEVNLEQDKYSYLTKGQKETVKEILCSKNQFSLIQGDAGTGKTTALKIVNEHLDKMKSVQVKGMSFTGKAAKEIQEASKIDSSTVHSFLFQKHDPSSRKLWIVDEASLIPSMLMRSILDKAITENARVVLIGDVKQLKPIQAGIPFEELQKKNILKPVMLNQTLRQKTDHLKQSVQNLKDYFENGDRYGVFRALDNLDQRGNIVGKDSENKIDDLINSIADKIAHENKTSEILSLSSTNKERAYLNDTFHQKLEEKDYIKESKPYDVIVPKNMEPINKVQATQYKEGDYLRIFDNIEGLKNQDQFYQIKKIDAEKNQLQVAYKNEKKWISLFEHGLKTSVLEKKNVEFGKNEHVIFLKNDNQLGVKNGELAKVTSAKSNMIKVEFNDGRKQSINLKKYPFLDYGYVTTTYKSQGMTSKEVNIFHDEKTASLNKFESLNVGLTRAKEDAKIVTGNFEKLVKQHEEKQKKSSTLTLRKNSKTRTK